MALTTRTTPAKGDAATIMAPGGSIPCAIIFVSKQRQVIRMQVDQRLPLKLDNTNAMADAG